MCICCSYTIVGMAAMAAGGTRTLSSAVIVFEMTMSLNYMTPVMVATVIGMQVLTHAICITIPGSRTAP